jgi:hypothetical protein
VCGHGKVFYWDGIGIWHGKAFWIFETGSAWGDIYPETYGRLGLSKLLHSFSLSPFYYSIYLAHLGTSFHLMSEKKKIQPMGNQKVHLYRIRVISVWRERRTRYKCIKTRPSKSNEPLTELTHPE